MKIRNVKFLKSATKKETNLPVKTEIALVGRSNVGKSSLINYLVNSTVAKKSSSPGRTRLLNYFEINDGEFMLVDLPGYGYSLAGKTTTDSWGEMLEGYFKNNSNLKHVLLLIDSRINSIEQDLQMIDFMVFNNISFSIIMTKCDKLSASQLNLTKQRLATLLKVGVDNIFTVSTLKKFGKEEILNRLDQFV